MHFALLPRPGICGRKRPLVLSQTIDLQNVMLGNYTLVFSAKAMGKSTLLKFLYWNHIHTPTISSNSILGKTAHNLIVDVNLKSRNYTYVSRHSIFVLLFD